jgi:hypothetical protein
MKFIAVNTIGLTGAEIVAAELARFPEVLMLPGQNFIGFGTRTYRPHDYTGWDAHDVFRNLNKHHFTRAGRVWSGLTKAMTPAMLENYDQELHESEFVASSAGARTTIDHWQNFATSFARATGRTTDDVTQFGFFGFNMVLTADHYDDFLDRSMVVDFTAPIDFWLANIGQRAVWDCLGAIRFWLTNMLVVRRWARRHPEHYVAVDLREFAADPDAARAKLVDALSLTSAPGDVPGGFVAFDRSVIDGTESIAADLTKIYTGWNEFDLAATFGDWADRFLDGPDADRLLDRFESFWNTTSHTNLDWAGPVADELVEAIVAFTGAQTSRNVSRWFYHECYGLNSDNWENPTGTLEHYLGEVEDEIVLPATAAHARIVFFYLEKVADNMFKRAYSALPLRDTSLYTRLRALEGDFAKWALEEKAAAVEALIDEADEAMAKFSS